MTLGLNDLYEETWGAGGSIPEPDSNLERYQSNDAIKKWTEAQQVESDRIEQRRSFLRGAPAAIAVATISPEEAVEKPTPNLHEPSQKFIESIEGLKNVTPEELAEKLVDAWVDELHEVHKLEDSPNFPQYIKAAISNYIKMSQGIAAGSGRFTSEGIMSVDRWHDAVITFAALIEGTIQKAKEYVEEANGDERAESIIFDENGDISESGKDVLVTQMRLNPESDLRIFYLAETFGIVSYNDLPSEVDQTVYKEGIYKALNTLVGTRRNPFLKTPNKNDYHSLFDHEQIDAHLGSISSLAATEDGSSLWVRHGLPKEELGHWKQIVDNAIIARNINK